MADQGSKKMSKGNMSEGKSNDSSSKPMQQGNKGGTASSHSAGQNDSSSKGKSGK